VARGLLFIAANTDLLASIGERLVGDGDRRLGSRDGKLVLQGHVG
jgi:hypothetical protein